jgi:undecaprenyl-diphosphatase
VSSPPPPDETRQRVERVLEREVEQVDSPESAAAVIERLEDAARRTTEVQEAQAVAARPLTAAQAVERIVASPAISGLDEAAAVLATTAAEAVATGPEAPAVEQAARAALGPEAHATATSPQVRRGRGLLRQAVLRRMGPAQALDARLFLLVNGPPHPRWLDALGNAIAIWANGGWIWAVGVLVARQFGVRDTGRVLKTLLLGLLLSNATVEGPVKAYFRRRRPFIDVVRALVVGRKPGGWSFPSGHTSSAFTAATIVSAAWPRGAPVFFLLASWVGFSRVYVGVHYPGDVVSGAVAGVALGNGFRRLLARPFGPFQTGVGR